jgi:predicted permease
LTLLADLRHAVRALAASPGFTMTAVFSIGLGIGLGASIFSQLEALVFRAPPGLSEPEGLASVNRPVSFPTYEAFRDESGQFRDVAAYMGPIALAWKDSQPPSRIWGQFVTPNYFRVLGASASRGRVFGDSEHLTAVGGPSGCEEAAERCTALNRTVGPTLTRNIAPVAIVSDRFWRERLNSDPAVIGKTLRLNGKPVTILGVGTPKFGGASPLLTPADIFIPLSVERSFAPELGEMLFQDKKKTVFNVIGRLAGGVTMPTAQAALDTVVRRFEEPRPGEPEVRGRRISVLPGGRQLPIRDEDLGVLLTVPLILVGLVLWIACSNVGTMTLARFSRRNRDIAIRLALGSGRSRIIRALLTETLLLALLGGVLGLTFAVLVNRAYGSFRDIVPGYGEVDLRISSAGLAFTFVLSLASGLLFGTVPAIRATRSDLVQALKPGAKWQLAHFRWFSWRNVLVLQQVAGSLALLLLTGFIVLGLQKATSVDVGIQTSNLYMMSLDPIRDGYSSERTQSFFNSLQERTRRIKGVADAALSYSVPIGMRSQTANVQMRGQFEALNEPQRLTATVEINRVGAGFFETAQLPILSGRSLTEHDAAAHHVVVNETLAKQYWPGQAAIGKTIDLEGQRSEVAGVARDINVYLMGIVPPTVFQLMSPDDYKAPSSQGITLMVRGTPNADILGQVRKELSITDPDLTVFNATSANNEVSRALYLARYSALIYGGIGLFGLILAAVGLGGVTAYTVVQRNKEIGIRVALGATKFGILRLVTREGIVLVLTGTAIGFAAAFIIMRILAAWINAVTQITKTTTSNPLLLIGAPALLASLTLIACFLPARRSLHVNPVSALRDE